MLNVIKILESQQLLFSNISPLRLKSNALDDIIRIASVIMTSIIASLANNDSVCNYRLLMQHDSHEEHYSK